MIAILSACCASFGRCSLILMPGALVSISLKGPPLAWPGLRSNVSVCEGPPFIHNRMQERRRCGLVAVSAASAGSQPDSEAPRTPAVLRRSQSRREIRGAVMELVLSTEEFPAEL